MWMKKKTNNCNKAEEEGNRYLRSKGEMKRKHG